MEGGGVAVGEDDEFVVVLEAAEGVECVGEGGPGGD